MKNFFALLLLGALIFTTGCDKDDSARKRIYRVTVTGQRIANRAAGAKAPATRSVVPEDRTDPQWLAKYVTEHYSREVGPDGTHYTPCRIFNFNPANNPYRQRDTVQGRLFWVDIDVLHRGKLGWLFDNYDMVFVAMYVPSVDKYINLWCDEPNSGTWEELNPGIDRKDYYEHMVLDTVAYVPNRLIRETRDLAQEALDRGDTLACQRIFDEHLKYYPITGAEYRELQARGEN